MYIRLRTSAFHIARRRESCALSLVRLHISIRSLYIERSTKPAERNSRAKKLRRSTREPRFVTQSGPERGPAPLAAVSSLFHFLTI
jgi:hypothetical protein